MNHQDPVSYLMRVLAIYEQQFGSTHPDTQTVRNNYVSLLETIEREGTQTG